MKKRRYSDNEKHFWPFTWSISNYRTLGIVLNSGKFHNQDGICNSEDNCHLLLHLWKYTLICELPQIIAPYKKRVESGNYSYLDIHPKEYGFRINDDGFVQVFFGAQTMDSITTENWCTHLPFTQWRFHRQSWYSPDGRLIRTDYEKDKIPYDAQYEYEQSMPKSTFEFRDYDSEIITAEARIKEREWRFGQGWFKWLSFFKKPLIRKELDLRFSSQVGPEKGSWKGGCLGHGIEMLPNETPEQAFRRYCDQTHKAKNKEYKIEYIDQVGY